MAWNYPLWIPGLKSFSHLETLSLETPGVLISLPVTLRFSSRTTPEFSATVEEMKLAERWSTQLPSLQTINLTYGERLYSGYFIDPVSGNHGRDVILKRVDLSGTVTWIHDEEGI